MKARPVLSCKFAGWEDRLKEFLKAQAEVDLLDFDYAEHGDACELLARQFSMEMTLDRVPEARALHFRKLET